MAIPTDYPTDKLPPPLVGKSRRQLQNYDVRDTFDGNAVKRQVRNSSPVYFDVSFRVRAVDRAVFSIWLEQVSNGESFVIPLATEGGVIDHTCFFTELPLSPSEESGDVYTFSGEVFAQQLNNGLNTATDEEKELIFELGNDVSLLAQTVNESWPT